ncbi:MAG: FISUMP domain-containing protein [Bacteroidales bacterium]
MKKITFLFLMMFATANIYSQTYTISFSAIGAANSVDSVKVENLTHPTIKTWHLGDIFQLVLGTSINETGNNEENLQVFPNPMQGQAEISFYAKQTGNTTISIYDIAGKKVLQTESKLLQGNQKYQLIGLKQGMYFINIIGDAYFYTSKLISQNTFQTIAKIEFTGSENSTTTTNNLKSTKTTVNMAYTTGDRLLFKGISSNYSNIITDIPTASKTITFNFTACSDIDNNNYATVQIGTQIWMAENLKTTHYKNGAAITYPGTDNTAWQNNTTGAYAWYNNNEATYKNTYGALYNWFTVNTGNLCPIGWHVPTDAEWTSLTTYLGGESIAGDKLKATTLWISSFNNGATNSSGFTALPGGWRDGGSGTYYDVVVSGGWWSSTDYATGGAWLRIVNYYGSYVVRDDFYEPSGFSVRCLRD